MGKTVTPRNRIEYATNKQNGNGRWLKVWNTLSAKGRWNDQKLADYMIDFGKSFEVGGTNEHISREFGYVPYPVEARVVDQFTGEVKAEWKPGAFVAS